MKEDKPKSIEELLRNLNTPADAGYTGLLCPYCKASLLYKHSIGQDGQERVCCFPCNRVFDKSDWF